MYAQSVAMMPPEQAALVDPVIKNIVAQAEGVTRRDILAAQTARDELAMSMARFHLDYDVFLLPVMPCQPWVAGRAAPPEYAEDEWGWCPFAYPFNMTRQPAASVPMGFDTANMPLAVQVVAAYGQDDLVFRAALALEQSA
jgi:aspartyl-tRNA(Asn)/glutamyl-tRNA(Gln) amidotransferase subunit A